MRLIGTAALLILVSGTVLTLSGDVLADQTGLGASFVGVVLLAASTSLPELSTTIESAWLPAWASIRWSS